MKPALTIRPAEPADLATLNAIALAAKAHWGYPPQALRAWRDELTLTPATLDGRFTRVAVLDDATIAGFGRLDPGERPWALTALWVDPPQMRRGVGSRLLDALVALARAAGQRRLGIDSDPNAEGFYLARGARRVGTLAAPLPGQPERVRPQLSLAVTGH